MSITNKLASAQNRKDEAPNIELAQEIAESENQAHINELVDNLCAKKDLQNDSIKVLYEIGALKPQLIANHLDTFIASLPTKNNRLQWGLMTAISTLVEEKPKDIIEALPTLLSTADSGSVITKDQAVKILISLCKFEQYKAEAFPLLNEQLLKSATNQLPMYAELAMEIIDESKKAIFINTLQTRLPDIEKDSKRKRVERVIKKLS